MSAEAKSEPASERKGVNWNFIIDKEGGIWLVGYVPNVKSKNTGTIISGVTILFGFDLGQQDHRTIRRLPISEGLKNKLLPFAELKGADAVNALEIRDATAFAVETLNALNRGKSTSGISRVSIPEGTQPEPVRSKIRKKLTVTQWIAIKEEYLIKEEAGGRLKSVKPAEMPDSEKKGLILTPAEAAELAPAIQSLYEKKLSDLYDPIAVKNKQRPFSSLPYDVQTGLMSNFWSRGWVKSIFLPAARGDWADVVDTLKATGDDGRRRYEEAVLIARGAGVSIEKVGPKEQLYRDFQAPMKKRDGNMPVREVPIA